jgi:hypothetical protein
MQKCVKPQKHGIVYNLGSKPSMLGGEPQLGFPPVRIKLDKAAEKLSKEARVNYSKLVTVEHNVKVRFIGRIVPEDLEVLDYAVNQCWSDKRRIGERSSRKTRR